MKKNTLKIVTTLVATCFLQFESSAALIALCTQIEPEKNKMSDVKIIVEDNWKQAIVIPQDENSLTIPFLLTCTTPKSSDVEFTCSFQLNFSSGGYSIFSFARDAHNKMSFVLKSGFHNGDEMSRSIFECVEE